MRFHPVVASLLAIVCGAIFCPSAFALTVDMPVTPAWVNQSPGQFTITQEMHDGMLRFNIKRHLANPSYLVSHTEFRRDGHLIAQSSSTSFARESSVMFYVLVSPEEIKNVSFELFEGSFQDINGQPSPNIGGINYQIHLAEFVEKK